MFFFAAKRIHVAVWKRVDFYFMRKYHMFANLTVFLN